MWGFSAAKRSFAENPRPGRGSAPIPLCGTLRCFAKKLIEVRNGEKELIQAVHEYEQRMIKYGFKAVMESRKQMDDKTVMHKPIIGRIALAGMRTGMRLVNALPAIKKKMSNDLARSRGEERYDD
ncbi:hypothetical protein [Paenibacillus chitinolyticus]|uniref:hypothetical protein n=1 Tax=Paenibacillus chitinolyticus TaxID=79263 RepID=UPI00362AA08A